MAKEKFQPDIFLYENNKSAAQPIKDAIYSALGGGKDSSVRLTHIDSALVSAQHRERFYVTNFGDIEQPEDRGILLRDVLESGEDLSCRERAYTLTASYGGAVAWNTLERNQRTMVAEPIRIGTIESNVKNKLHDSKQYRVYSSDGKATTLCGQGGGVGAKTGLYVCPINEIDGKPIYTVRNGLITIKDKQYPVKLRDGYYIIRKLTPTECERLQTMPDGYTVAVSNSQRLRALGNGWTAEIIIHILNHALKDVPRDEELVVLSMNDSKVRRE